MSIIGVTRIVILSTTPNSNATSYQQNKTKIPQNMIFPDIEWKIWDNFKNAKKYNYFKYRLLIT